MPRKSKLPGCPYRLSDDAWYYLEARGILVVQELRTNTVYVGTSVARISWARVRKALEAHDNATKKHA